MIKFTHIAAAAAIAFAAPVLADDGHGHGNDEAHGKSHGQFAATQSDIATAKAGTYRIEPSHAYISFSYNHLGFSYPVLGFNKFDGTLNIDPAALEDTSINVTIDANSIESRVAKFNDHLKGEGFFDVANHPEITFVSTAALPESAGSGKIAGDLTIKGITKPVVLDVVLHKAGANPINKKETIGVSAKTTIKRSEWDLGRYAPNVSDEVKIIISAEFQHQHVAPVKSTSGSC